MQSSKNIAVLNSCVKDQLYANFLLRSLSRDVRSRFILIDFEYDEGKYEYFNRCRDIIDEEGIGGVLSFRDDNAIIHAAISEYCPQIKGPKLKPVMLAFHKWYARQCLMKVEGGVGYARLDIDTDVESTSDVVDRIGLPVILKPCCSTCSNGISKVVDKSEIRRSLDKMRKYTLGSDWDVFNSHILSASDCPATEDAAMVEEYIDPYVIITVDGLVVEGKIIHWAIVDNCYSRGDPDTYVGGRFPSAVSRDTQDKVWSIFDTVINRMIDIGFDNQFVDIEMFVMEDGTLKLMEINARMASPFAPIYRLCLNKGDPIKAILNIVDGIIPSTPTSNGQCGLNSYIFTSASGKKAEDVIDYSAAAALQEEVLLMLNPHDVIVNDGADTGTLLVLVNVSGRTHSEAMQKYTDICKRLVKIPELIQWEHNKEKHESTRTCGQITDHNYTIPLR